MYKTKIIAHRGGALDNLEHSWKAFETCIEKSNIHGIEFDIQFTKDNVAVIVHDMTISINNQIYLICETYYHDLEKYVISLQQLLNFVQGKKQLFIEIKGNPLCFIISCIYDQTILEEFYKKNTFSNITLSVDCISNEFLMMLINMNISIFLYTINYPKLYDYIMYKYKYIYLDGIITDCPSIIN